MTNQEKCEALADQFKSVFTVDNGILPICPQTVPENSFVSITVSSQDVVNAIRDLNGSGSPGLDKINPIFIKNVSCYLITPLQMLFQKSIDTGVVPDDWRKAVIVPIQKKNKDPAKIQRRGCNPGL